MAAAKKVTAHGSTPWITMGWHGHSRRTRLPSQNASEQDSLHGDPLPLPMPHSN